MLAVGAAVVGEPAPQTGQAVGEVVVVGGVRPRVPEGVGAAAAVDGERGALAEEGEQAVVVVVDGVRRLGRTDGEVQIGRAHV